MWNMNKVVTKTGAARRPFFYPNSGDSEMDQRWQAIVEQGLKEALDNFPDRPIAGAPLSQIIRRKANQEGLEFPPDPFKSFRHFIKQFDKILQIQERPGQDILIVPAGRTELLVSDEDLAAGSIRRDIFVAVTQIANRAFTDPYYIPELDSVKWVAPGTDVPNGAVPFDRTNFEQEISDRTNFINESQEFGDLEKLELRKALKSTAPLGAFSNVIKRLDLSQEWHKFHMTTIVRRLEHWCTEKKLTWKSSWLVPRSIVDAETTEEAAVISSFESEIPNHEHKEMFAALADVVDESDLARIMVPLDILAKAWKHKAR